MAAATAPCTLGGGSTMTATDAENHHTQTRAVRSYDAIRACMTAREEASGANSGEVRAAVREGRETVFPVLKKEGCP